MSGCLGTDTCLHLGAQPPDILVLSAHPRPAPALTVTQFLRKKRVSVCMRERESVRIDAQSPAWQVVSGNIAGGGGLSTQACAPASKGTSVGIPCLLASPQAEGGGVTEAGS